MTLICNLLRCFLENPFYTLPCSSSFVRVSCLCLCVKLVSIVSMHRSSSIFHVLLYLASLVDGAGSSASGCFPCQSFHTQPPPLLTLPLILDHRWKSSSQPLQMPLEFDEGFYSTPSKRAAAEQLVLLMTVKKTSHSFLVLAF